jgi:DNA transformation protein
MANKPEYLSFVTEWLTPLGPITSRSMFGGHTLYCGDRVIALVADNVLHLKVDDVTRSLFEARGLTPFQPFPDNPATMSYYPPPPEFFEDLESMREWGRMALEAANRAKAKKPARKRTVRKAGRKQ